MADDLSLDLEELRHLHTIAKRPRVVSLISSEIRSLEKVLLCFLLFISITFCLSNYLIDMKKFLSHAVYNLVYGRNMNVDLIHCFNRFILLSVLGFCVFLSD